MSCDGTFRRASNTAAILFDRLERNKGADFPRPRFQACIAIPLGEIMRRSCTTKCILLIGVGLAHTLLGSVWQPFAVAEDAPPAPAITKYVPADAMAAVIISPTQWLNSPMLEMFPLEVMRVQVVEQFGIDPFDVHEIKLVVLLDNATMQPAFGSITTLTGDMDFAKVRQGVHAREEMIQVDGHETYPVNGPPGVVLAKIDERTLFYGTASLIRTMLDAEQETGKLPSLLHTMTGDAAIKIAVVTDQIRPMLSGIAMQNANKLAPELQPLAEIPGLTDALKVQFDLLDTSGSLQVALVGTDEVAAQRIQSILVEAIAAARVLGIAEINRNLANSDQSDAMREATNKYANRMAEMITKALQPKLEGDEVTLDAQSGINIATTGVLVGLLLPAVQSARTAARRMNVSNNMKQVMLALHNYHSAFDGLPAAAISDENGNPLLSWRVAILPFIEEQELYGKFHLDEPWDSEHNLPLSKELPKVYDSPNVSLPAGRTVIQAVVGDDIGLRPIERTRFRDFLDGTSNSIMIMQVDADAAVIWSKPEDLEIDMNSPLEHLGSAETGGFHVGLADGAIRFISTNVDPELFKKLLTRAGNEPVDIP